ncbi:methyltransferase domain-containing protein [Streptomyces sp. NBC_01768]|uniref:methyltransferase domain-containing protein n=1 Tax=Streptomyces sp. NBC_01768 TaxID=2975938 RepID=UPI002DDC2C83|nr:methyltransferase domain-containing protein [Streptomyces sp. NBC_01768]WSC32156.1 methyltransferase domain-containing protein [Streptomyces sp. NBC_01768]
MQAESGPVGSVTEGRPIDATSTRLAMVERLQADGVLTDPRLRDALSRLDREVLMPRAYVRRSEQGSEPVVWELLDGAHPEDRAEWQDLVYSGESVLVQRDGEQLENQVRGVVNGGRMTAMSTFTPYTVEVLQRMRIDAGHTYLDLGTGPGVSLALAAALTGPGRAVGVERDEHMAAFAQKTLGRAGVGARVMTGDAVDGHAARAPYDRIHSGIEVPCLPSVWVDQLAPGGRLLTTLATRTPSWPGHCLVTRTAGGHVEAVLEGGPRGHRPLHGYTWLTAQHHLQQIANSPGKRRPTAFAPPPDHSYGFWLAAAYLVPGVVRHFQADTLTVVAPEENSWAVAGPGDGTVRVHGPRDVWAELDHVHDL